MKEFLLVMLGGLLTLGGSTAGPFFQNRQQRFDAKRQDLAILRDRAQDIFDEIDIVVRKSQLASISALQSLADRHGNQPEVPEPVADLGRLRGLVAIYYPSALPILTQFELQNVNLLESVQKEFTSSIKNGAPDINVIKALTAAMPVNHQKIVDLLSTNLRNHITERVTEYAPKP